jgi:hypothetical protein
VDCLYNLLKKEDYEIVALNISTYFILKYLEHNVGADILDCVMNLKPAILMPSLTRHCVSAVTSHFDTGEFCKVTTGIEVTGLLMKVEIFTTVKNSYNRHGYDIATM